MAKYYKFMLAFPLAASYYLWAVDRNYVGSIAMYLIGSWLVWTAIAVLRRRPQRPQGHIGMIKDRRRLTAMGGRYVEQFHGEWDKLHARMEGRLRLDLATDGVRRRSRANPDGEMLWARFAALERIMDDAEYLPEDAKP